MSVFCAALLTFALHASVLLSAAWLIDRALPRLRGALRELLWRCALLGAAFTAALPLAAPAPWLAQWHWTATRVAVAPAETRSPDRTMATAVMPARASASADLAATTSTSLPVPRSPVSARAADAEAPAAPFAWQRALVALWLAGVLLAWARLAIGWSRLRHELHAAVPVADSAIVGTLAQLSTAIGVAPPRLLCLHGIASPLAVGERCIVLPDWACDTLDADYLRAMLAHELGHLQRHDPLWKVLVALWRALLWFLPPAAHAARRLDDLAELACDAFAAQHAGSGRRVAECLASCAEHHVRGPAFDLAPAMAARQSLLMQRIDRLLDADALDTATCGALPRALAAVALTVAAFGLPAIGIEAAHAAAPAPAVIPADAAKAAVVAPAAPAAAPAPAAKPALAATHSSLSVHGDDHGHNTITVSVSDDAHKLHATIEGTIAFNDAETEVVSLSAGGTATFDETVGGVRRQLELREQSGRIAQRYIVDGSERPFDDGARAWLASFVKQLARSGIGADERARRMLAKGGAPLLLDEIDQLPNDYVRAIYLRVLVDNARLTPAEVERAVKTAGAMHSDYERHQALKAVFDTQALDAARQVLFLRQALHFDSDYDRAELLIGTLPKLSDSREVRQAWLAAALKLKSDYDRRRTLQALLAREGLDDAQLASVIEASGSMQSDYEHRQLLVDAVRHARDANAIAPAYLHSAQTLSSDYERQEALLALIRAGRLDSAGAAAVLDSAASISSSYGCREVLVALARVMPDDAPLHERYRQLARRLPDYDRDQAERALAR